MKRNKIQNWHQEDEMMSRAVEIGKFILKTGSTVRVAAAKFNVSKTTAHRDVTEILKRINPALWKKVRSVLDYNMSQRHIRGGMSTKKVFEKNKI